MDEKRKKKQKKGLLCCTMCGFKTSASRLKQYEKHLEMHSGDRPAKCDLCSYSSKWSKIVKAHKVKCHPLEAASRVKQVATAGGSRRRELAGKWHKKTGNAICLPKYPPAPTDTKHYKSPYCTYWALAKSAFRDHLSKCHADRFETEDLFSCSLCSYTSSGLSFTQVHVEKRHGDQEADILIHEELTDEALERHLQCPVRKQAAPCPSNTPESEGRAERRKRRREERLSLPAVDSVKRKRGSICYKESSNSCSDDSDVSTGSKKDSLHSCPSCSFTAPWKDVMEDHLRNVHNDFRSPQLETEGHRRSTRKQKQSTQDVSEPSSSASYTLVEKAGIIETYCCRSCSFATVELEFFHEHMVAHTRNKKFGCTRCGYRTNARRPVEDHVKRKRDHVYKDAVLLADLNPQVYDKHKVELPYNEFARYNEGLIYTETLPVITEEEFQRKVSRSLKDNHDLAGEGTLTLEPNWIYCCPKCSWKTDSPKRFQHHFSTHEHVVLFLCTSCPYASHFNIAIKKHIARMKQSDQGHESAEGETVQMSEIKDFKRFMQLKEKPAKAESPLEEEIPPQVEKPAEPPPLPTYDGCSSESAATTPLRIEELSDEEATEERTESTQNPEDQGEKERPAEAPGTAKTSLTSSLRNLKADFLRVIKGEIPKEPARDPLAEAESEGSPSTASVETEPAQSPEADRQSPELILISDSSQSPAASLNLPEREEEPTDPATEPSRHVPEPVASSASVLASVLTDVEKEILGMSLPGSSTEKEVIDLVDKPESTTTTTDTRSLISVRSFAKEPNNLMVCVVESTSSAQETSKNDDGNVGFLDTPQKRMSDLFYSLHQKEMQLRVEMEKIHRAYKDGWQRLNSSVRRHREEAAQLKIYQETLTKLQQRYDECRQNHIQMSHSLEAERQSLIQTEASISSTRKKKLLQDIELKRLQVEVLQKDMELLGMAESEEKEALAEQLRRQKETVAQSESTSRSRVEVLASMEANFRSLKEQIEDAEKKFEEYGLREMLDSEKALREAQEKVTGSKKLIEDLQKAIVDEKQTGLQAHQQFQKLAGQLKRVQEAKNAEKQRCKEQPENTGLPTNSPGLEQGRRPPPPQHPNAQPVKQVPVTQTSRHGNKPAGNVHLRTALSTPYRVSSSPISPVPAGSTSVPALLPISTSYQTTATIQPSHESVLRPQCVTAVPALVHIGSQQPHHQVVFQTQQMVMVQGTGQPPQLQQSQPAQQAAVQVQQPQWTVMPAPQTVFQPSPPVLVPQRVSLQSTPQQQHQNPSAQLWQNQSNTQPIRQVTLQPQQQHQPAQTWLNQAQYVTVQPTPQQVDSHQSSQQPRVLRVQMNAPAPGRGQSAAQQVPVQCRQNMSAPQQRPVIRPGFVQFRLFPAKSQGRQLVSVLANQQPVDTVNQSAQPRQQSGSSSYVNQLLRETDAQQGQQQQRRRQHQQRRRQHQQRRRQQHQQQQQQSNHVTHQLTNGILLSYDPDAIGGAADGLAANGQS